jgi:Holliday junction resolvasome RuvABC ATP-dependent DNA helicase subunit
VPVATAAQFSVSAIAALQKETIMNTAISAITRTNRGIRRTLNRIVRRLTRKASINLRITVSVPPFLKFVLDYKADIGDPVNDNSRRRKPR